MPPDLGDRVAALDGNWGETEKKLGDKIAGKAQARGVDISKSESIVRSIQT